jgi:hypothetical protein
VGVGAVDFDDKVADFSGSGQPCGVPSPSSLGSISLTRLFRLRVAPHYYDVEIFGVVHREFIGDSLLLSTVCLQVIKGDTEVSEPRGGGKRRWFVEDLERRTEHAKRLLDEIERQHHEVECQDLLFTTPTAKQLEHILDRTETPQART